MFVTLVPAYGRDYKNQRQVREAWKDNQDFQICDMFSPHDGRKINKQDAEKGTTYNIRYKNLTQVLPIKG